MSIIHLLFYKHIFFEAQHALCHAIYVALKAVCALHLEKEAILGV